MLDVAMASSIFFEIGTKGDSGYMSITSQPTFITIGGSLPDGRELTHSIVIRVEHDDGEILVSETKYALHASASTLPAAITEFKRVLAEELDLLSADEEQLGPRLQAQLHYLRTLIKVA